MIDGQLRHADSHGGAGILNPGDAQWMTAGRGVIHDEQPAGAEPVHVLQLWINLPRSHKLSAPRYQDLRGETMPVHTEPGVQVRVFAGRAGQTTGPAKTHSPLMLLDIRLEAGARYEASLPGGYNGFITVLSGNGRFGADSDATQKDDTLWLERMQDGIETRVSITADTPLHVLLAAGTPLNEPVSAYGPFVMNTEADILQAIHDYRAGTFGQIPLNQEHSA